MMSQNLSLSPFEFLLEREARQLLEVLARCRNSGDLFRHPEYQRLENSLAQVTGSVVRSEAHVAPRRVHGALRIVHWNIDRGKKLAEVIQILQRNDYLRLADVLIMTETDIGMARSGNVHVAEEVAKAMGYSYLYVNSYLCLTKGTREELHIAGENQFGLHGITLFSRLPIEDYRAIPLPTFLDKMRGNEKRMGTKRALAARLSLGNGRSLGIAGIHLDAKSSPRQRASQMKTVLRGLNEFFPTDVPVVAGGDLNTTTYSNFNPQGFVPSVLVHWFRGTKKTIEEDYRFPERYYERLFPEIQAHGFEYESLNALGEGTLFYDHSDPVEQQKILEHLPRPLFNYFLRRLEPYGDCVSVKADWFFGRGVRVLKDAEHANGDFTSRKPVVLAETYRMAGTKVSDHVPIGVDIETE